MVPELHNPNNYTKILILAVDRDDDIGSKTGLITPIVGRDACFKAASQLAVSDPEEADANTIIAAIGQYDNLRDKGNDCEVAIVAGKTNGGIEADQKLGEEFRNISSDHRIKGVVLVTDGVNDKEILPILQSEIPVISVKRVVVKHSRSMEESYAILGRYLRMLIYDRRYSRYALGVPGLLLLIFGSLTYFRFEREAFLISIGILGIAAIIRGFELDRIASDFTKLTPEGYVRLFSTLASILTIIVAILQGYTIASETSEYSRVIADPNLIMSYGSYLLGVMLEGSIDLIWVGITISLVGALLYHRLRKSIAIVRDVVALVMLGLLYIPIREFSLILSGSGSTVNLISYLLIGLASTFILIPFIYKYLRSKKRTSEDE